MTRQAYRYREAHEIDWVTAETCPTGKRLYATRKDAKTAARRRGVAGGATRLDAYRCRDGCDGFHIGHHQRKA